jgi:hypothetical protein
MNTSIKVFNDIVTKVQFLFKQLKITIAKSTGRTLAIQPEVVIALSLFKQAQGILTKKSVFEIFNPRCSYKTLVVNMNRYAKYSLCILQALLRINQRSAHIVKHTDSTDIPVCLNKNAKSHKTMRGFASFGHSGKGFYYGLKMSITTDLRRNILAVRFASGASDDRITFKKMNEDIMGIFVADSGYISEDLAHQFFIENKRVLFAKPRANMKKLITAFQYHLYNTRMLIEINFRNLKMFHNLVTSLPRSVNGYVSNYTHSLLAYVLG